MRFSADRCLQCGTPARGHFTPSFSSDVIEPDGSVMGTCFWFCSNPCFMEALKRDVDRRYQLPRTAYDDDIPDRNIEQFIEEWNFQQLLAYRKAAANLAQRTAAEYGRHVQELIDDATAELEKRQEQQRKEDEKLRKIDAKFEEEQMARQMEEQQQAELLAPKEIPPRLRFEHTHILGPSGSGKTTLIENIVLDDLFLIDGDATADQEYQKYKSSPAYVIIDPKGEMIDRLSRLHYFGSDPWNERIVIVDPFETPALNLFDARGINPAQMVSYFSYIFSTTRQKLTGKQLPCFMFCIRLLFNVANADLFTLLDLLDDRTGRKPTDRHHDPDPRFQEAIGRLTHAPTRRFFETDFYSPLYSSTREEIKSRVYGVMTDEYLPLMFNASKRKLDMRTAIKQHKIVLVNTRMARLKEAHQTLGRYILALTVDALQSRAGTDPRTWDPVFIVIDEFQEFADDEKTPEMLRLIREYNGGAILAHQNMHCAELDQSIRSAISTNTSIKYCSRPGVEDLNYMANNLQCEPDFLTKVCQKTQTHARFACFFTGLQHPFLHEIPLGEIASWERMDAEIYRQLRARNRQALYAPPMPARIEQNRADHSVSIRRGPQGFIFPVTINGVSVLMELDTGATEIVLTHETARKVGFDVGNLPFTRAVLTANGATLVASVSLDVAIGSIVETAVRASISQDGHLHSNLLGMSFLDRLAGFEVRDDVLVLRGKTHEPPKKDGSRVEVGLPPEGDKPSIPPVPEPHRPGNKFR